MWTAIARVVDCYHILEIEDTPSVGGMVQESLKHDRYGMTWKTNGEVGMAFEVTKITTWSLSFIGWRADQDLISASRCESRGCSSQFASYRYEATRWINC